MLPVGSAVSPHGVTETRLDVGHGLSLTIGTQNNWAKISANVPHPSWLFPRSANRNYVFSQDDYGLTIMTHPSGSTHTPSTNGKASTTMDKFWSESAFGGYGIFSFEFECSRETYSWGFGLINANPNLINNGSNLNLTGTTNKRLYELDAYTGLVSQMTGYDANDSAESLWTTRGTTGRPAFSSLFVTRGYGSSDDHKISYFSENNNAGTSIAHKLNNLKEICEFGATPWNL